MTCPVCGGETDVSNTRHPDCETVTRQRKCRDCGHIFKTVEIEEEKDAKPKKPRPRPKSVPLRPAGDRTQDGEGRLERGVHLREPDPWPPHQEEGRGGLERDAKQVTKLEKEIEAKLRKMVAKQGGLCLKWVCPGWVGVPDRIILMPGGRIAFVELKRPKGGRLSKMQEWWMNTLAKLGFSSWVIWNEADLAAFDLVLTACCKNGKE